MRSPLDSRGSTALLYIVAVALIGGFMYWLYLQTQRMETTVRPAMQDTARSQQVISLDSLRRSPEAAIGKRAAFDSITVASGLGRGVFTLQIDSARTYPVLMNPDIIQRGEQLYGGDVITVGGRFYTYTDSIGQEWVESGAVSQAASQNIPSTASFLLADSLVLH